MKFLYFTSLTHSSCFNETIFSDGKESIEENNNLYSIFYDIIPEVNISAFKISMFVITISVSDLSSRSNL